MNLVSRKAISSLIHVQQINIFPQKSVTVEMELKELQNLSVMVDKDRLGDWNIYSVFGKPFHLGYISNIKEFWVFLWKLMHQFVLVYTMYITFNERQRYAAIVSIFLMLNMLMPYPLQVMPWP